MKIVITSLLAAVLLTSVLSVQAQNKKDARSFIGITGGLSLPGGDYSKGDYNNDQSGFAKTGFNIGVTGAYYFKHSHFGIGGILSYTHYGFKNAQGLADGYKEAFDVDSSTVYIKGNNQTINILVGPYYTVPLGKLSLDFRLLGGLVNATLPGNEVYLEDGLDNRLKQDKSTASAFGWQGGAAIRYTIVPHIGVFAGVDYFYSKPNFSIDNENRPVNAGRKIDGYHTAISGVQTNLGLVYEFGK
ncbi:porin family protein [Chitinophaga agrisoli]|uniref:Porin family protein n=1 Tax=Chitinophaga agrisoli TaxID=2607653 RepID=A0A5B2VT89_9BACT|nr:outer membrane beta-barrel protein [Chitinophaga agrisoli]KAA2243023.1 porin family protein [Chitinophaga agrisoli]